MQTTKWANKTNLGNVETLARNQAMFPDLYEEHIIVCHALIELHLFDACWTDPSLTHLHFVS